jgi:hypothetical protein
MQPGQSVRPVVTISVNPRAGELGASIAGEALGKAIKEIDANVGKQLSSRSTSPSTTTSRCRTAPAMGFPRSTTRCC